MAITIFNHDHLRDHFHWQTHKTQLTVFEQWQWMDRQRAMNTNDLNFLSNLEYNKMYLSLFFLLLLSDKTTSMTTTTTITIHHWWSLFMPMMMMNWWWWLNVCNIYAPPPPLYAIHTNVEWYLSYFSWQIGNTTYIKPWLVCVFSKAKDEIRREKHAKNVWMEYQMVDCCFEILGLSLLLQTDLCI